jgi:hypothetical protein
MGYSSVPSGEVLVRIFSDFPIHQALLRDLAGAHFKNFENHLRGKHQVSPTTLRGIAKKLGVDERLVTEMKHGQAEGPLLPALLSLFGIMEALPNLVYAAIVKTGIPCQHCGENLIDDRDIWWKKQSLRLPKPVYDLIERVLGALLVATGFGVLTKKIERESPIQELIGLSHPSRHPFGHWITKVMQARGVESYFDLCSEHAADDFSINENRSSKWASGGELLPIKIARLLTARLPGAEALVLDVYAARTMAFLVDLAAAAAPLKAMLGPTRKRAQDLIYRRLETINQHILLFARVLQGRLDDKLRSPAGLRE